MRRNALVIMYTHVEGYPPSLNAIQMLSKVFDQIHILHRNTMQDTWPFPSQVSLEFSGNYHSYSEVKRKSGWWKLGSLFQFTLKLWQALNRHKPEWLLIHEPVALLAWGLVKPFYNKPVKVWYHNHDVILGKESFLFGMAYRMQNRLFPSFSIFSLPASERLSCFPMEKFNGKFFFIPNFPGRYLYDRYYHPQKLNSPIRLVYQGHIGSGHGLEQVIELMSDPDLGNDIILVLKGFKDEVFFKLLMQKAAEQGVNQRIEYHGVSAYHTVPEVSAGCHIGIGIHTKSDIMNRTLGTASNKIYEYAALGLPVLLFDNAHFREHLGRFSWAVFTDTTIKGLSRAIQYIISDYQTLRLSARKDFENELNFEKIFEEPLTYLSKTC